MPKLQFLGTLVRELEPAVRDVRIEDTIDLDAIARESSGSCRMASKRLRSLAPLVRTTNTSTVPLPPKVKDEVYTTPQYAAWRAVVVGRAGGRCEAVDKYGHRCINQQPHHRMYADHIVELKDNGSLLDVANGQCLCASHHEIKTINARIRRLKT